ncbi:MAG: hypothetical protein KGL11_10035 [Alphaproteobacteria bacterium]|nr:hypothetical protein [Alphaproteobacteria bacterium]
MSPGTLIRRSQSHQCGAVGVWRLVTYGASKPVSGFFDGQSLTIKCPACGHSHQKTIAWLKTNDNLACVCGKSIHLDKKGFDGPLKNAEDAITDFKRQFGGR